MKFSLDFTPPFVVKRAIEKGRKDILAAARRGMKIAVQELIKDALNEPPTIPFEEGDLRASVSGFVGKELVETTQSLHPEANGTPARTLEGIGAPTDITGTVVINTPYAHRLHEHPEYNYKTPGSGGKFLESKIVANHAKYMRFINSEVARALVGRVKGR